MSTILSSSASPEWWRTAVFYQIYPRSFQDSNNDGVGDLKGITSRLDYLAWLGINALWISPCFVSPMADFGYDVADYKNIDPIFGSIEDMDELLREAHARGLKVLLDFVPNHTSDQHEWFKESRSSRDSPKRDWYLWKDPKIDEEGKRHPPNNWLSIFGGSGWTWDEHTGQYYYHGFLKEQPELNWRNPELYTEMMNTLRFWLDRNVDGFRVDVIFKMMKDAEFRDNPMAKEMPIGKEIKEWNSQEHIYDGDRPEVHDIVRDFRTLLNSYEGDRMMVGEVYILDPRGAAIYYGEKDDELNLVFNFCVLHQPWEAPLFKQYLEEFLEAVPKSCQPTVVFGSHDESRMVTRWGREQCRVAATMLLTHKGAPFIYNGDELGMEDGLIPEDKLQDPWPLRCGQPELSRDPCRTPMCWSSEEGAGFTAPDVEPWLPFINSYKEGTNVADQTKDPLSMLNLYRALLQVRAAHPVIACGSFTSVLLNEDKVYAYRRDMDGEASLVIVLNFSDDVLTIDLTALCSGQVELYLSSSDLFARQGTKLQSGSVVVQGLEAFIIKA